MAAKLEDSNLANHGNKEHRAMRQEAAKKEPAWENVGAEAGIQIWRIEKFIVKHWPKEQYGEFYNGDSYIILNTMISDEGKKSYDVFFWLGAETTQDEAGSAAYKTVELDDLLGDLPVQYRECGGNESKKFLTLFPQITILEGGVETGFRHVSAKEYKPRLLHVSGFKKNVQVYQVKLNAENLNDSDAFVLDCGTSVFQFNGTKSSGWLKRKANAVVDGLKSARHGKVKSVLIIDGIADDANPLSADFWEYFGGKPSKINDCKPEVAQPDYTLSLHHISDASGIMQTKEVCKGKLDKSKLDGNDAFILDGGGCLFVWIGKGANRKEKREAMKYACKYLRLQGRDTGVPVARVMEGNEPAEFWACFSGEAQMGRRQSNNMWHDISNFQKFL